MKLSEFKFAVEQEFGAGYGGVVVDDLVLDRLGGRTARAALAAGVPAREVWQALCEATDVPLDRRHGPAVREPGAASR
ncbi:DUF3046 domain-containing protein [Agromyces soli]